MPFIHYLFLGHFERDGEWVRFTRNADDAVYRPVVRRPLDTTAIEAALKDVTGADTVDLAFPDDWPVWLDAGYLVCDKYTRNQSAIDFITTLVSRTRCDIYDAAAHGDITLADWLSGTTAISQP